MQKDLKRVWTGYRQCIFTDPILTLAVETELSPEARSVFRKQDFYGAFLSLEQIHPEWQKIKWGAAQAGEKTWVVTWNVRKEPKLKSYGKSPGVGCMQQGKWDVLFLGAWLSWEPSEDGEISGNYGFPSGWPSTGLNRNIGGDTWIV